MPHHAIIPLLLCLSFLSLSAGCGEGLFGPDFEPPRAYKNEDILAADRLLRIYDFAGAQAIYARLKEDPPDHAVKMVAYAGHAVSTLLQLPGHPIVRTIIVDDLGAENTRYDATALIWGDDKLLHWIVRGASWEDSGQFKGIRSLLSEDLPWSEERLTSVAKFADGITVKAARIATHLGELADAMAPVNEELETLRLERYDHKGSDPWEVFYLPSELFRSDELALVLGYGELALLNAGVYAVRGGLYWVSAHANDWSPAEIFGSGWAEVAANPEHPEYVVEWTAQDYPWAKLDPLLFREVKNREHARKSTSALRGMFYTLNDALSVGSSSRHPDSSLRWDAMRDTQLIDSLELVNIQMISSLSGDSSFSDQFTGDVRFSLGSLFGRWGWTLPETRRWFTRVPVGEMDDAVYQWQLSEDTRTYIIDQLASPSPLDWEDRNIELIYQDRFEESLDRLFSPAADRIEQVYFRSE